MSTSPSEQLASIAARYWDAQLGAAPTSAALLGDHRFDHLMEDLSAEAEAAYAATLRGLAAAAEAVDPAGLSAQDRVTRAALVAEAGAEADQLDARTTEYLVDPMLGPQMALVSSIPQLTPQDGGQADAYVAKAAACGAYFDQAIDRLRAGLAAGRLPVAALVDRVLGQLDDYLAQPLPADPFLSIGLPDGVDEAAWRQAMTAQVDGVVRPAVERYRSFVAAEVRPTARPGERAGLGWLAGGEEQYRTAIRRYTTLDLGADEIHELGLAEVEGLGDEYRGLGGRVLGITDLAEIYDQLRNDPSLRFETAEQVIGTARKALARANEAAPGWFGRRPRTECVVKPMPEVGAADAPLALYQPPAEDGSRPGTYFINHTEPATRTRFEAEPLAFHESVPGHHLQLALAQEAAELPAFRRNSLQTAYVEGWGLYTERLADEMGLYSNDLARLGVLSFDSWRACRLVVDTGMHALGWSRRRAIDYMVANSPQATNNIANEVDRYIGWPGQALAYKLGQREILRLRTATEAQLGPRFDVKAFHDTVLGCGPVPLPVLDEIVRGWAAAVA